MGIINGTSETTFSPDENITREDVATLIFRFVKLMYPQEAYVSNKIIADRDKISDYALSSVDFCFNNGIMNGTGNDMFSPKGLLTRQEAMVLMYNICTRYKVIENGRECAITGLKPVVRGLHEMLYDGYLYIRVQRYPFSFNNTIEDSSIYTLIRTPLDQLQKNKGEILFSHVDEISDYAVNEDNIFFCDRSLNRAVYSTDKNGKNMKLLYNLSEYTRSDFSYMHVDGDWLFVGAGNIIFKMRTDGTCLSIIHSGYDGSPFYAEGKHIYLQGSSSQDEYVLSRASINGDEIELLHSNKKFDNSWAGGIFFNNKFYVAILEKGMEWATGVPLIEIDVNTKAVKQIQTFFSWTKSEALVASDDGVYVSSVDQNKISLKSITGSPDINITYKSEMGSGFAQKYGNYLYFSAVGDQRYTRYYYIYNIESGAFTDIYGNLLS